MTEKENNSHRKWAIAEFLLPTIISVLTLAFGISQYIDKRNLEIDTLTSEARIKELERRNKELEIQDSIQIKYIDADLVDLYTLMHQADEAGGIKVHGKISKIDIDNAMIEWIKHIGENLKIDYITLIKLQPYQYFIKKHNR